MTNMTKNNKELNIEVAEEIAVEVGANDTNITLLKEMAENGVLYGHKKTKTQPKFKPFIFTTRNGMEIIDLSKTLDAIDKTAEFLSKLIKEKKTVLLIGTKPASWEALEKLSVKFGFPRIKNRWIGGLLTNFKIIYQRLEYYRKTTKELEKGELDKYTKKERVVIAKRLAKMKIVFEGLENFTGTPDAVFIIDTMVNSHDTALREAKIINVPVIALIDSDDNPEKVEFPIPANDHSKLSINWVIDRIISLVDETK